MYNPLAKRIGNVMDEAVKKNQERKKPVQKPVVQPKGIPTASKDPAMIAATEAARKRSEAYLAAQAAENVVPKITRKK